MIHLHVYEMDTIVRNEALLAHARRLTLGYPSSGMNQALDHYQRQAPIRSIKAKGIFAYDGETPVGWCLLTGEYDGMSFDGANGYCVQVFVHPNYRRQRIGSRMLTEAALQAAGSVIKCYGWGEPDFFNPFLKQGFQSL
jgi:GNAT superfamily N-acetyltransferase